MSASEIQFENNVSILIVEDDSIVASDIKELLEEEGYRVIMTINPGQALLALQNNNLDLALLDINLETDVSGIDLASYIDKNINPVPYVFLTSYTDKKTLDKVKETNPRGYIAKPFHKAQLLSTVSVALASLANHLMVNDQTRAKINQNLMNKITEREWTIIQLLSKGLPNNQIAKKEFLSVNTIKYHVKNIYEKLDVHNRAELLKKLSVV